MDRTCNKEQFGERRYCECKSGFEDNEHVNYTLPDSPDNRFYVVKKECQREWDCESGMACIQNKCVRIETTTLTSVTTEDSAIKKKDGNGLSKTTFIAIAAIVGVVVICGAFAFAVHKKPQGNITENREFGN